MEYSIRSILERLSKLKDKPYIKNDKEGNADFIKGGAKYLAYNIVDKVRKTSKLVFNKRINFLQRYKGTYSKYLLCRVFGNKELQKNSCFCIMIYFDANDKNDIMAGIKIDRNSIRLDVDPESEKDIQYEKQVDDKVKEIANRLFLIKEFNKKDGEFHFNQERSTTDRDFVNHLNDNLKILLPIYRQMCAEGFELKPPKKSKPLNPDDFDFASPKSDDLTPSPKKRRGSNKTGKFNRDAKIKEDDKKAERGKKGEDMINRKLKKMENVQKIEWISSNNPNNKHPNDYAGFDFKITYKNATVSYVDVKTTSEGYIFITDNELCVLKDTIKKIPKENYFIWAVDLNKKKIYQIEGKKLIKSNDILRPTKYKYKINPKDFIAERN